MTYRVTFDDAVLSAATPARREEFLALAADLADAVVSLDGREGELRVSRAAGGYSLREGEALATVDPADLEPLFVEYLEVITRLGEAGEDGFSRVDALDMAKRVTHDRGGRVLKRQLRPLGYDHEACRRVFSLLLATTHDTSALPGAHAALRPDARTADGGSVV